MKLNLGCGKDYRQGWVNVDIDRGYEVDVYMDLTESPYKWHSRFSPKSASYILLSHVFEHLTFTEGRRLLYQLSIILHPQGTLEIAVPDFTQAVREYLEGKNNPLEAPPIERIYGNQSTPYEVHKSGYTKESLTKVLNLHDFTITEDLSTEAEIRFKCKILPKASVLNVKNLITQSQHRKE